MIWEKADGVFNREIGKRIQIAREYRNYSSAELVELIQDENLSRYESGQASMSLATMRRISIRLDVPIYYFLGEVELLQWFDERRFVNTYRILKPEVRMKVCEFLFSIAGDRPVL